MAVDRVRWTQTFTEADPPSWPCPTCGQGSLLPIAGSFRFEETRASLDARNSEAWEPHWLQHRFVAMFRCSRPQCSDVVTAVGDTVSEEYYVPDPANAYAYVEHGVETRLRARY